MTTINQTLVNPRLYFSGRSASGSNYSTPNETRVNFTQNANQGAHYVAGGYQSGHTHHDDGFHTDDSGHGHNRYFAANSYGRAKQKDQGSSSQQKYYSLDP